MKTNNVKYVIEFLLYFLLVQGFLISVLNLPSFVMYLMDVIIIFLCVYTVFYIPRIRRILKIDHVKSIIKYMAFFMIAVIIVAIIKYVPILHTVWAIRNNFFYILFFFFCIIYLNFNDAKRILKVVARFQILNFICVLIEYFVLHKFADFVGGMFGIEQGCNGLLNIYLLIISIYALASYMEKKMMTSEMAFILITSIICAALSELKVFYVELALIVLFQLLLGRKSLKAIIIAIIAIAGLFVGIGILTALSESSKQFFSSFDEFLGYNSSGYYGSSVKTIMRFSFISQINELFFNGNVWLNLFGYGFGYCESSQTFSFFHSSFATSYEKSTGYRNLSSSILYLETGAIGLIAVIAIFAYIFIVATKYRNKTKNYKYLITFTQVLALMIIVNMFYDSSIRRNIAYLIYFALSVIFIMLKEVDGRQKLLKLQQENKLKNSQI